MSGAARFQCMDMSICFDFQIIVEGEVPIIHRQKFDVTDKYF